MTEPTTLPSEQRFALLASDGPARFKHFIAQAADKERLWSLCDNSGWVALTDDSGAPGFPVWPHPDYAAECAIEAWAGCSPAEIDVHEFVESWLSDMSKREVAVAVFPTPSMKGVWISPAELKRHLVEELAKYE